MVLIGLVDFGSSEMENLGSGRAMRVLAISGEWHVVSLDHFQLKYGGLNLCGGR